MASPAATNPLSLLPPGFELDQPAPLQLVNAPQPLIPDFALADPRQARPKNPLDLLPPGFTVDQPAPVNPIDLLPEGFVVDPPAKTFAKGTMPEIKPTQAGLFDQGEFINAMVRSAGPETLKNAGHSMLAVSEWSGDDTWSSSAQELIDFGDKAGKGIKPPAVESMYDIGWDLGKASDWIKAQAGMGFGSTAVPLVTGITGGGLGSRVGGKSGGLIGAGIGAYFGSEVLSIGEVRQGLIEAGVTDPKLRGKLAVLGGSAMAALDTVLPAKIAAKMTGVVRKEVQRKLIKHMLHEAKWGVITEAPTEGAQELVKQLTIAEGTDKFDFEKAFWDVVENTVAGAIGGGTTAGATSPLTNKGVPGQPLPPPPPTGPTEEEILRGMGLPGPEHAPPEQGGPVPPPGTPPGAGPIPGATPQDAEQAALWQELGIIPETPAIPMPAPAEAPIQPPVGEVAPAPVLPEVELPVVPGWPTQESQPLQPLTGEVLPPEEPLAPESEFEAALQANFADIQARLQQARAAGQDTTEIEQELADYYRVAGQPGDTMETGPQPPPALETQITPPISGEPLPLTPLPSETEEIAQIPPEAAPEGGTPFMVTMDMKRRLRGLGYSPADIRNMAPADAQAILTASPQGQQPEVVQQPAPEQVPGEQGVSEPLVHAPPMQDVPRAPTGSIKIDAEDVQVGDTWEGIGGKTITVTGVRKLPTGGMRIHTTEGGMDLDDIAQLYVKRPAPEPTLPPLESMPSPEQGAEPLPIPEPESVRESWRPIGTSPEGHPLFEDERGVRSFVRQGVRVTESVGMRPTREGGYEIEVPTEHEPRFTPVEEAAPAPAGPRPLNEININVDAAVSGEGPATVRMRADQALIMADKRIIALNRLMECLNG